MIKIQITGLPCSGKTTAIKYYLKKNKNIEYIDIRSFEGPDKFNYYKTKILKSSADPDSRVGLWYSHTGHLCNKIGDR